MPLVRTVSWLDAEDGAYGNHTDPHIFHWNKVLNEQTAKPLWLHLQSVMGLHGEKRFKLFI